MPTKGLQIPVNANKAGGSQKVTDGTKQLIKILQAAIAPGDDENPFQDLGMKEDVVFQIDDPSFRGMARQRIKRILAKYSDRVALSPNQDIGFTRDTRNGTVFANVKIINLETDDPLDFQVQLT